MGTLELLRADFGALAVDAQVNPWNCNLLPWFLLLPRGVSASIRRHAGWRPFFALWLKGRLPVGQARVTDGGRGPARYLIHVTALDPRWRATPEAVQRATDSALRMTHALGCRSVALPLIGAGVGGLAPERSLELMWPYLDAARPAFDRQIVAVRDAAVHARLIQRWPGSV